MEKIKVYDKGMSYGNYHRYINSNLTLEENIKLFKYLLEKNYGINL